MLTRVLHFASWQVVLSPRRQPLRRDPLRLATTLVGPSRSLYRLRQVDRVAGRVLWTRITAVAASSSARFTTSRG
jgi:hypothetical protein